MHKWLTDLKIDILTICGQLLEVIVKVTLVYVIISHATNLDSQASMETAILVGAVDFLSGSRTHLHTVTDIKERVSLTERGKKVVRTVSRHTTKDS